MLKYSFLDRSKTKPRLRWAVIVLVMIIYTNCIETFEPATLTFEDILVVEAMITDELKQQEILLSRTTPLEDKGITPESNATVTITDGSGNEFVFIESVSGTYMSQTPFSAEPNTDYRLAVQTANGQSYISESVSLSGTGQINDVRVVRIVNRNGTEGAEINVDGSGVSGSPSFFRYEFEETYQIIAPFTINRDLVVASENPPRLDTIVKTRQERVCYNTEISSAILLSNSNNLNESKIENFPVHFIARDNPILKSRYSILVKQFVHTRQAYSFYETLSEISDLDNLFSQQQPGFVEGNISSVENPDQNVLGIFEVASVSTQRIFFSFRELFTDGDQPPYFVSCSPVTDFINTSPSPSQQELVRIKRLLEVGYKLISFEEGFFGGITSYTIAPPACGNCTALGSNVEPEFWEE